MNILDRVRACMEALRLALPAQISVAQVALVSIMMVAVFTRFWRLGTPDQCYFDESFYTTTGAEILRDDEMAWNFVGHENAHPPLSKLLMAGGMAIFGHDQRYRAGNNCWFQREDAMRQSSPEWSYEPFGWRFFGAVAGVGSVLLIYLLAKKLFESEVAGLTSAFLLTFEGLAFVQSRIATPDTYVLFFMLGTLYFLVSERYLLSGILFGAATATKLVGAFSALPIACYLIWRLLCGIHNTARDQLVRQHEVREIDRVREIERVLWGGVVFTTSGVLLTALTWLTTHVGPFPTLPFSDDLIRTFGDFAGLFFDDSISREFAETFSTDLVNALVVGGLLILAGLLVIVAAVATIVLDERLRKNRRCVLYLHTAIVFLAFFLVAPFCTFLLTYIPMLLNGHSPTDAGELVLQGYTLHHHNADATHPYESPWISWPIMGRPIYLYSDSAGITKIYSLGNPLIFWFGLAALAFVLWQALRHLRGSVDGANRLGMSPWLEPGHAALFFVVLSYLALSLPLATQSLLTFIYHYIQSLAFVILALAYCIQRLLALNEGNGGQSSLMRRQLPVDIIAGWFLLLGGVAMWLLTFERTAGGETYVTSWGAIATWSTLTVGGVLLAWGIMKTRATWIHLPLAVDDLLIRRAVAIGFLVAVAVTFVYFYPHLAAVQAPGWLERTYYWEWLPRWLGFNWR